MMVTDILSSIDAEIYSKKIAADDAGKRLETAGCSGSHKGKRAFSVEARKADYVRASGYLEFHVRGFWRRPS